MVEALCLCLAGLVFGASATAKSYPEHWFRTPDAVGLSFCEWNHYTGKSGNQQTEISCYHEKYRQGAFVDSRAEGFKTTALSLRYPNAIKTGRFTWLTASTCTSTRWARTGVLQPGTRARRVVAAPPTPTSSSGPEF